MDNETLYSGYDSSFLANKSLNIKVELPILGQKFVNDVNTGSGQDMNVLNYLNYSLLLSKSRKFPFYTAANIDGLQFKKAERATNWKKDQRAKEFQWGKELYSAIKSDFDKGHMTKREDVQWGATPALAQIAADSTFYYSNAVPQHKNLNQKIWKKLEDYILHSEAKENQLKICLFTGPVLSENDPFFVTPVNDQKIQLPTIFWKVIIYPKSDGKLYRVGFYNESKKDF